MRVLVVGGGGREHALVWHLANYGHEVFCAPGNAGIRHIARCEPISTVDLSGLAQFALKQKIDLTIVGPEGPLVAGAADDLERHGLKVLGPGMSGARIEADKAFAKELMLAAGIPTARFQVFTDYDAARNYVRKQPMPVVVKAAGLAAGKGVVIAQNRREAERAVSDMLVEGRYGDAGRAVVIEEFLDGEEVSMIGLCDGRSVQLLAQSQDHKRLLDGDEGPNTGGMGAYAPAPAMTAALQGEVQRQVFSPLLTELARREIDYRGVIYAGLILTAAGPRVLEFNCRFGDPETQVILPLLDGDLAELALACVDGRLREHKVAAAADRAALCVVAAAEGYPGSYHKGMQVTGDLVGRDEAVVFHAGTRLDENRVVTSGGRVLGVTGIGHTLAEARDRAYKRLERIHFQGMCYRRDIGAQGLARRVG
ncbi:MAG: phosphoribosylamine--glycine ligase [candidate division WOR-3 bacterium]|nr:phosphoribosylamine--glycine ligase [candidate division WOR-3 bacterium]